MKHATKESYDELRKVYAVLETYLSENPIGDEYQVLTEAEWNLGNAFVDYLSAKGIVAFEEQGPSDQKRTNQNQMIGAHVVSFAAATSVDHAAHIIAAKIHKEITISRYVSAPHAMASDALWTIRLGLDVGYPTTFEGVRICEKDGQSYFDLATARNENVPDGFTLTLV